MPDQVRDRVSSLRHWVMAHEPSVCHERAAIVTDVHCALGGALPPLLLRAESLAAVLDNMSIFIGPGELIVGNHASRPRATPLFPEYSWEWIHEELDSLADREADRFLVPPETHAALRRILPEWRGRSFRDRALRALPDDVLRAQETLSFILTSLSCGVGHLAPDYARVLRDGLDALITQAERQLEALDLTDPAAIPQRDFFRAAIVVGRAAIRFAQRYAALAEQQARDEPEAARRAELREIARICRQVPARPAQTLQEAIQSFWFLHLIIQLESNGHSISPGRFDQYMFSFFQADIAAGRLDVDRAQELLDCLWIKFNEILKLRDRTSSSGFGGYPMFQNLIVGGQHPHGGDATNALSYLCLQATRHTRLPQPSLSVRLHAGTPWEFLEASAALAREGLGMPAFFNDEIIIPVLLEMGVRLPEARDYAEVGCVEPQAAGKTNGYYTGGYLNLGKALNLALNNGVDPVSGTPVGSVDPHWTGFGTYADVVAALDRQLVHLTRLMVAGDNILDSLHATVAPNAFVSLLVDACMERGRCYEAGGAVYNYTAPNTVGLANVADALMALKAVVFDQKKLAMEDLLTLLRQDYAGREDVRQLLLNRAPKYGNDEDAVDAIARELSDRILQLFKQFTNSRGGRFAPGFQSISAHGLFRHAVAATPDGRRAHMLLADGGISPAQGRDRCGPTGVIKSAAKLDHIAASNGTLLNIKLSPTSVAGVTGLRNLIALIRTYFQLGGQHVQFNIIDTALLRDAQAHPEAHRDLIVRVAGFSVLFTTIDRVLQEDIIERTEHRM